MISFALNALWQIPLIAAAAWMFLRLARLSPAAEHRVWVAVLACSVALPGLALRQSLAPASDVAGPLLRPVDVSVAGRAWILDTAVGKKRVAHPTDHHHWAIPQVRFGFRLRRNLGWLYIVIVALATVRTAVAGMVARRLLQCSLEVTKSGEADALWAEVTAALKLSPSCASLRLSQQVCSPAVMGAFRPVILLPLTFHLCAQAEQRAALLHELAHVKRRDCLMHMLCQLFALPVVWHPGAHFVLRQIARTREMSCDALAATVTQSRDSYARSLLRLAQSMSMATGSFPAAHALGLFRNNQLEERIMRLTESTLPQRAVRVWMMRGIGTLTVASALAVAGFVHVRPVYAQSASSDTKPATETPHQAAAPESLDAQSADITTKPHINKHGAVVHGSGAHVIVRDGEHVHRWTAADGEPFVLLDDQAAGLTDEQKHEAEAEYLQKLGLADKDLADLHLQLSSPEFNAQMDKLTKDLSRQTFDNQKQLAEQLARVDSAEWQAKTKKQIDDAMAQLKTPQFNAIDSAEWQAKAKKQIDEAMAQLKSQEFNKKMDEAMLQAQMLSSPEMDKRMAEATKRMDDASRRLQEATKAMAEAQRQLEQQKKK